MAMNLQTPTTSYVCQTHQAMKSDESIMGHRKMEIGPGSSLSRTRGMRGLWEQVGHTPVSPRAVVSFARCKRTS